MNSRHKLSLTGLILMTQCAFAWSAASDRPVYREPPLMIGRGIFQTNNSLDYDVAARPGQAGGMPAWVDQRESGRFVVARSERNSWTVNERLSHFGLAQPIAIPQINASVPTDLWSLEAGAGFGRKLDNGRDVALNFSVGSDSNKPFYSIHETAFRFTGTYRIPSGQTNAWILALTYSNNRHFFNRIPLPGVAYFFRTQENRLEGIVGFPFAALRYKPAPDWTLQMSLFGPRNISAEIARRIAGPVHLYGAFRWNSDEWMIADRQDYSDRLFFNKKRLAIGIRSPLPAGLALDISGGREFDEHFFINDSSSYKDIPTAAFRPAWYFEGKLSYRFAAR